MTDSLAPLIADFVDWLDREPRTYADAMDAWRTSCPRLTVWEDAMDHGLVSRERRDGTTFVVATEAGRQLLRAQRHASAGSASSAR